MHSIIYPPDDVNERSVWREHLHQGHGPSQLPMSIL
jgi:hypothetical protein